MSAKKNHVVYEHVRQRLAERYGLHVTMEQWLAWNGELCRAVAAEGTQGTGVTVREIDFEGKKVTVLCSNRRVLTVLVRSHAIRLWQQAEVASG